MVGGVSGQKEHRCKDLGVRQRRTPSGNTSVAIRLPCGEREATVTKSQRARLGGGGADPEVA